jgi:hypothetical protein
MDKVTVVFITGKTKVYEKAGLAAQDGFLMIQQGDVIEGYNCDQIKSFTVLKKVP